MITFRQKGDFSNLTKFLERAKEVVHLGDLDKYGRAGVAALASTTLSSIVLLITVQPPSMRHLQFGQK